jgi:hypothetical protein
MGAERKGNAGATIPEWSGGVTTPPGNYVKGKAEPDPFAGDKPLFTITAANYHDYLDTLTPGQVALFKNYPDTFRMNIYPTRRSAAYPPYCYDAVKRNAASAEFDPDNYNVNNWEIAVPFPVPRNALEALNNHLLSYRPPCLKWNDSQAIVNRNGAYQLVRMEDHLYTLSTIEGTRPGHKDKTSLIQTILAPPRLAGQVLLAHAYSNKLTNRQQAWIYNPGQRRVRKAPQVEYDGPGEAADGLRTTDDYLVFNGAPDRYNWTLKGKQEAFIPYNSFPLVNKRLKYDQILGAGHINPAHVRYERHRVWVLEAQLKPDCRHIYKKRVFYQDEDTWLLIMADTYDNRNELWRVVMAHSYPNYVIPFIWLGPVAFYDLQARRYLVQNLSNEEPTFMDNEVECNDRDFNPAALRRLGTR